MDTLISGIVKSAMSEILKKTIGKSTTTKRTKRKTRTMRAPSSTTNRSRSTRKAGPTSGSGGKGGRAAAVAKKQVSKRRTSAARSRAKRR